MRRTVFVDRDGTLCVDQVHNVDVARLRLMPRAKDAVRLWRDQGWRIVMLTNQSGIGRGLYDEAAMARFHAAIEDALGGERFDAIYHCPHLPDAGCECRKPKPGMLHRARRELGVDLATSFIVGDSWRDVEAGRAAGCWTVLVPSGAEERPSMPDHRARDLLEAAEWTVREAGGA